MLKRLLVGLVVGLVMGSLVAALVIKGLGVSVFAGVLAYVFAAVTGVVTGLVAGKPIWAAGGQIEAALKAVFGAAVSIGLMYALRHWVGFHVDLTTIDASVGAGTPGELPALSLPLIAGLLGAFYSADNTPGDDGEDAKAKAGGAGAGKKAGDGKKMRVADKEDDELDLEGDAGASKRARR